MDKYIKLAAPVFFSLSLGFVSFFFSEHLSDLREGPTLVYSLDQDSQQISLTLSNVGGETVEGAFILDCEVSASVCFEKEAEESELALSLTRIGAVAIRQISEGPGHGEGQLNLMLTLPPDATVQITAQKAPDIEQPIEFSYAPRTEQVARIMEERWITGKLLLHYMDMLAWGLLVVLVGAVSFGIWLFVILARRLFFRSGVSDDAVNLKG
ncbi:hypothetical protein MLD63_17405 [Paracoccus sp. TK19116]|uniref:Uncharacterized protein n=1 Tax=Paracoccus albicereus TaxID=2922394 RepID=A0ABT1MX00_9RHOB|nr:hypothetical protein [Paracoccus albicereus]MCQ0972199.1 hypothetical protein [Paracoccus albicereus]